MSCSGVAGVAPTTSLNQAQALWPEICPGTVASSKATKATRPKLNTVVRGSAEPSSRATASTGPSCPQVPALSSRRPSGDSNSPDSLRITTRVDRAVKLRATTRARGRRPSPRGNRAARRVPMPSVASQPRNPSRPAVSPRVFWSMVRPIRAKISPRPILENRSMAALGWSQPRPDGPTAMPPSIRSATVGTRPWKGLARNGTRATTVTTANSPCKPVVTGFPARSAKR